MSRSVPPTSTLPSRRRSSSRQLPAPLELCMRRAWRSARSACTSVSCAPTLHSSPAARAAAIRSAAAASSLARRRACASEGLEPFTLAAASVAAERL